MSISQNWPFAQIKGKNLLLYIEVKPGSNKSEIVGIKVEEGNHGRLIVRLAAQAKEGEANKELIAFLGKALKIPKSQITLISGQKARQKNLECLWPQDSQALEERLNTLARSLEKEP
jgi:uncharacterized protein (TIGR00251 family)